jgi:hypothetical protein
MQAVPPRDLHDSRTGTTTGGRAALYEAQSPAVAAAATPDVGGGAGAGAVPPLLPGVVG